MTPLIILTAAAGLIIYLAYYFSNTVSSPSLWPALQQIRITDKTATIQLELSNESQTPLLRPRIGVLGNALMLDHKLDFNTLEMINANETIAFEMKITGKASDAQLAIDAIKAKLLVSFVTSDGEERFTQFNLKSGRFRETRRKP